MQTVETKKEVHFKNGHLGWVYLLVSGWAWCAHCNHWVRLHPEFEAELRHEIQN